MACRHAVNHARIFDAETYLFAPRDSYTRRKPRFDITAQRLRENGLHPHDIVVDVGAGTCELARFLYAEGGFFGRYVPVDAWLDGVDLDDWEPPRRFEWFTALEIVEHLHDPKRLLKALMANATKGVVVTTPNPQVWDVLEMDPGHKTPISREFLDGLGFLTSVHEFHGKYQDGLAGIWLAP